MTRKRTTVKESDYYAEKAENDDWEVVGADTGHVYGSYSDEEQAEIHCQQLRSE